jgi:hypothetical protein
MYICIYIMYICIYIYIYIYNVNIYAIFYTSEDALYNIDEPSFHLSCLDKHICIMCIHGIIYIHIRYVSAIY